MTEGRRTHRYQNILCSLLPAALERHDLPFVYSMIDKYPIGKETTEKKLTPEHRARRYRKKGTTGHLSGNAHNGGKSPSPRGGEERQDGGDGALDNSAANLHAEEKPSPRGGKERQPQQRRSAGHIISLKKDDQQKKNNDLIPPPKCT